MKKIIIGIILAMVLATGCEVKAFSDSSKKKPKASAFICFELVSDMFDYNKIYRDIYTDVLYYVEILKSGDSSITPIAKADGTFLTYAEWKEKYPKSEQF